MPVRPKEGSHRWVTRLPSLQSTPTHKQQYTEESQFSCTEDVDISEEKDKSESRFGCRRFGQSKA